MPENIFDNMNPIPESEFDRLFHPIREKKTVGELFDKMFSTPNTQIKTETELEKLQDRFEYLKFMLIDSEEEIKNLRKIKESVRNDSVSAQEKLKSYVEKYETLNVDFSILKKDKEITEKNYYNASSHIANWNKLYEDLKKDFQNVKTDLVNEKVNNNVNKTNSEHLAKQTILLQQENQSLKNEVDTFKKQTTRLLDEYNQLTCQHKNIDKPLCGKCIVCTLSNENLTLKKARDSYKSSYDNIKSSAQEIATQLTDLALKNKKSESVIENLTGDLYRKHDMIIELTAQLSDLKKAKLSILESHTENQKLIQSLSQESNTKSADIVNLVNAMEKIIQVGMFYRKDIALKALSKYTTFTKKSFPLPENENYF